MTDQLDAWERAAHPREDHAGVTPHRRGAALMPTSSDRMLELVREANLLRGYLGEAVSRVKAEEGRVAALEADYTKWRSMSDTSFAGRAMAQIWADLYVWEAILNSNPQLRAVVEIGTWQGGLSGWLWAQAQLRGMGFATFDAVEPTRPLRHDGFVRCDVFAHPEVVEARIRELGEPLLLFCDGGNKPRELRTFAPMLESGGSLVLVHDWGTETTAADVPEGLTPAYEARLEALGSVTRAFRPGLG